MHLAQRMKLVHQRIIDQCWIVYFQFSFYCRLFTTVYYCFAVSRKQLQTVSNQVVATAASVLLFASPVLAAKRTESTFIIPPVDPGTV